MKSSDAPASTEINSRIQQAVTARVTDGKLDCADAFAIAAALNTAPITVGQTLDQMDCRITHCQLGLFGHSPQKKVVIADTSIDATLKTAIESAAGNGHLTCLEAWNITEKLHLSKISVSNACEGMGIKIKPCQLGAF